MVLAYFLRDPGLAKMEFVDVVELRGLPSVGSSELLFGVEKPSEESFQGK